uniref:Origin recognition complex subunit 4 C-terminal domain-containing protein n=1 Tax=Peronospora matthiolae TaxID=2874970 RepID=A0AAV1U9L5_9STRA
MYLKEEVLSARSALRMRLKSEVSSVHTFVSGNAVTGQGSLEAVTQLEQLFERTVQVGENQSGLLLGSDSSRRRSIVTHAMRNLRGKFGEFTVVYLNGVILQNELEAFKELTAQLTRATAVKHPSVSYWNMYEYLRSLLVSKAKAGDHVVVILDALDQFVREKSKTKQLLLYNLLDWLQAKDIKMGVLGITDNYNVVDNLEKRVRSRFSNLQIVVERPSFAQIRQHLEHMLSLDTFPWSAHSGLRQPSTEYTAAFSCGVKKLLLEQSKFLASLEFDYDIGKPQVFFVRLTSAAVHYLDIDAPLLSAQHFWRARQLLEQDHQLAVLETVTEHGIALLIGMGHLEKSDQKVFTLEMVYARWENFLRQHDMLTQLPTRSEAQKALENLLRLKLVKDAGDAFKIGRGGDGCMKQHTSALLQPEFRAVHLNFAPRTLEGMLRNGSIKCSTLLKEWAINGS